MSIVYCLLSIVYCLLSIVYCLICVTIPQLFLIASILVSATVALPFPDQQTCVTAVTDLMAIAAQADLDNLGLEDLEGVRK